MNGRVLRLRRVGRNVADLARMAAFHCDALGFEWLGQSRIDDPAWGRLMGLPGARAQIAHLRLGAQEIELVAFEPAGRPYPAHANAADPCFQHLAIVVADMDAAYAHLRRYGIGSISECGPQILPLNTGGVGAFKFRDPEGHPLELIHFPAGVGASCWQRAGGLFLGIDHSAIAVNDATASVAFYERLGLHVAGRSHNQGPAQARLDGVPGAEVDVVGLEADEAGPPHLELLGYRVPRGRSLQPPPATNDIVADRLVFDVDDLHALQARLGMPQDAVACADGTVGMLLEDPSGHRLLLQEGRTTQEG